MGFSGTGEMRLHAIPDAGASVRCGQSGLQVSAGNANGSHSREQVGRRGRDGASHPAGGAGTKFDRQLNLASMVVDK